MRYLSIYTTVETNNPPSAEKIEQMGRLIAEFSQSGELIMTEGCLPSSLGLRVRQSDGRITVTDGPFTESKELVAGFALLNASSREQAIEQARRFLAVAGDGECEIRQVYEAPAAG